MNNPERLRELAAMYLTAHGHEPFSERRHQICECPHPDCALVRAASLPVPELDGRLFDLLDEAAILIDDGDVAPSEALKCVYREAIREAITRLRVQRQVMSSDSTRSVYDGPSAGAVGAGAQHPAENTVAVEKLARLFATEYLTGHFRPLRDEEQKRFEQLTVVMLAFAAQVKRLLASGVRSAPLAPQEK